MTNVQTFLNTIGRNTAEYAGKFTSWEHLMECQSTEKLKELGIDVKRRKYLSQWIHRYR